MLTIRQDQVEAFRQYHLQKFEDEMVEHLKKLSPKHWKAIGEVDGRRGIRLGIERAESYGFRNRGPVCYYIELMFVFGSYFDSDPQYPWASAALNDSDNVDQAVRADRLWKGMRSYLTETSGPDQQHGHSALNRLRQARVEDFVRSDQPLEDSILRTLPTIYPEKCRYVGDGVLQYMIRKGLDLAHTYGFKTTTGEVVVVILTFVLGHRFDEDPWCEWVRRRMNDARFPDPESRAERLRSQALVYLEHALRSRGEG